MNKFLLLAVLGLSASAFARNSCEVDMIDNHTGRILDTFRVIDLDGSCKEGMKQCRFEIRQRNYLGRADCVKEQVRPVPGPRHPVPGPSYPTPHHPIPAPEYGSEARRQIIAGESAIMNNRFVTVLGTSFGGTTAVKSTDGWSTIASNIDRSILAETKGCINSHYSQVCVGNQVIGQNNRYSTVVGIQIDGRVVLKSTDGWSTLQSNVEPSNLVITR
ncbi:MAG TPA: hypothetical protein VNJ08_06860 [Bacteriovoracaceae bacterium]|nr:hypothetical protein [Bacteriovoracaceae bacterium]